jgi:hypothetical protein
VRMGATESAQAAPAAPPRRSDIWQRTKERVKKLVPRRTPGIVTPVAAAPAPEPPPLAVPPRPLTPGTFDPPATPAPLPAPKKREPIDELLQPER